MNKVVIIIVSLILALVVVFGGCTQTAPATSSDGSVTITPINSESASRIAELEARIRQLEADNQRLLTENQELSDNFAKVTRQLQTIESLVTSSSYRQTLSKLPDIQDNANKFATFLGGLPDLPPAPPGLTVAQIDDAINKARYLREILKALPPPPPLIAPPVWYELDKMKDVFIRMTEWMEDLEDLPEFLRVAGDFDDLRSDMITYLRDVATTASNTKSVLEEVRNTAASE